ncbi:MAG: site-specific DNA-methyltransferase [Candidatus Hatepunaea meridiana]|nr:site-specific DNA-methyltransferase [Candidatus Hatepunaea meridiana]
MNNSINTIITSDTKEALDMIEANSVKLAVTSPPYWNIKDYDAPGQIGQSDYDTYINDLVEVFVKTERVLKPNGKLAIVTPIMPIPKAVINDNHTRHLKNINNDLEAALLQSSEFKMKRYSLFIWQKQTSENMFGSYPYPPNIYENNTIEFINVFVKDGKPEKLPIEVKGYSKLSQEEWNNLTMQIWPMYPADVPRIKGHPAPFPLVLPQRFIMMYTFKEVPDLNFSGDIVLDMFNGTGTTCIAAKQMGRGYIGIDINQDYNKYARMRLSMTTQSKPEIFLQKTNVKKPHSEIDQIPLFHESERVQIAIG